MMMMMMMPYTNAINDPHLAGWLKLNEIANGVDRYAWLLRATCRCFNTVR